MKSIGTEKTIKLLDNMKRVGFEYATKSGLTIGIDDMITLKNKDQIWSKGTKEVMDINKAHQSGLISETERYNKVIDTWTRIAMEIEEELLITLEKDRNGFNPLHMMVSSDDAPSPTNCVTNNRLVLKSNTAAFSFVSPATAFFASFQLTLTASLSLKIEAGLVTMTCLTGAPFRIAILYTSLPASRKEPTP